MLAQELQPLSGFRDSLDQRRIRLITVLEETFASFGYQALETPIIEKQELLLKKYGAEAQKLLYLFEDNGGRKVGLRYDLTVPLARFVAANYQQLPLPFKRYEIGSVFRAEKPQKGRYRQFTQADIDIVGDDGTLASEMEILEVVQAAAAKLNITLTVELNDRRIVEAALDRLAIAKGQRSRLMRLLDKKNKVALEASARELRRLGLTDKERRSLEQLFLTQKGELKEWRELVGDKLADNIEALLETARKAGLKAEFAPAMVRGLDYYTGPIFEGRLQDNGLGSVVGGGRYDDLVEDLVGVKLPAVGISFGVDRLIEAMVDSEAKPLFIINLAATANVTRHWSKQLRGSGWQVERFGWSKELSDQLKYATKRGYTKVILPLEELWREGKVAVKDLNTGQQETVLRSSFETKNAPALFV